MPVNVAHAPQAQADTSWARLGPQLEQAAAAVTGFLGKQYEAEQTAAVDEALANASKRFEAWKASYNENMQGRLAANAGQDYEESWQEISKEALKEFGGSNHEIFRELLERRLGERGLYASREGLAWQGRQTEAWRASQLADQADELVRFAGANPGDDAAIAAEMANWQASMKAKHPGLDLGKAYADMAERVMQTRLDGFLLAGDTAAARALLTGQQGAFVVPGQTGSAGQAGGMAQGTGARAGQAGRRLGSAIAPEESGADGIVAIGYDSTGGTSYGTYQLSSIQGSLQEWQNGYLAKAGPQGAALAERLASAGPANTGSVRGAFPEEYARLARENPELFEQTQHAYIMDRHYKPALANSPEGFRKLVESDPALQEMVFSTAVQHGGAGASRIFRHVWTDGMSSEELVAAVYKRRGQCFSSSTPAVRKAVLERFGRESQLILSSLGQASQEAMPAAQAASASGEATSQPGEAAQETSGQTASQASQPASGGSAALSVSAPNSVLSPARQQQYLHRIEAMERQAAAQATAQMRQAIDNFVASSEAGNIMDLPYSEGQVLQAFGDVNGPQIWQSLLGSQQLAIDLNHARDLSPQAQNSLLEERRPEPDSPTFRIEQAHFEKLSRSIQSMQKAMAEDPCAYAAQVNPNLAESRRALLTSLSPQSAALYLRDISAAYECLGMDGPLLSKQDSQALAGWIGQSRDPVQSIRSLSNAFGHRTPEVFAAISPELAPTLRVVAGMDAEAGRRVLAMERDSDFQKKAKLILMQRGTDEGSIREQTAETLGPVLDTFLGGPQSDLPLAISSATSRLAIHYMASLGLEEDKAVERAANEVISSRYNIIPGAKISTGWFGSDQRPGLRVPKEEDADAIARGLRVWLEQAGPDQVAISAMPGLDPDITREHLATILKDHTHWLTDNAEAGAILFLGSQPLMGSDGNAISLTWQELAELGRKDKARAQAERESALQGMGGLLGQ